MRCNTCKEYIPMNARVDYHVQVRVPNRVTILGETILNGRRKTHMTADFCSLNCLEVWSHANSLNNNGEIKGCN
jgi:hypothetical protein